jgi:hypothetical protein
VAFLNSTAPLFLFFGLFNILDVFVPVSDPVHHHDWVHNSCQSSDQIPYDQQLEHVHPESDGHWFDPGKDSHNRDICSRFWIVQTPTEEASQPKTVAKKSSGVAGNVSG